MIILDTCALLWLVQGAGRITEPVLQRIEDEPVVSVCAMSAFEIGVKRASGKLSLPMTTREWWTRAVQHHRLNIINLNAEILVEATELPQIHRDPADRIIIAAARIHAAPVVTSDERFADYGVEVLR